MRHKTTFRWFMSSPHDLSLHISTGNKYARIMEVLICYFKFLDELSDEAHDDPQFVGKA